MKKFYLILILSLFTSTSLFAEYILDPELSAPSKITSQVLNIYQLIDLNGKIILNNSINNAQTKVDLNAYSKGIYFIKVIKELKEIKTFKIIKN